jgi:UDP-GlcNAc:undecaprenyl-phosphate GlcNAc-1-phosphate transferase
VRLDGNAPAWHEGFHGRWDRKAGPDDSTDFWRLELPVFSHGQLIGRLTVAGLRAESIPFTAQLAQLAQLVADAEADAHRTLTPPPRLPIGVGVNEPTRTTRPLGTIPQPSLSSTA